MSILTFFGRHSCVCGKRKQPAHLVNSPICTFRRRAISFNHPQHSSILFLFFWLISYPGWRVVRSAMAMPMLRLVFCATCGVTSRLPHSATSLWCRIPCRHPRLPASHPVSVPTSPAPRPARLCHWLQLGIDDQVMGDSPPTDCRCS